MRQRVGYLYILPALMIFSVVVIYPLGRSIYLSFFNWDGLSPPQFVGAENYIDAWHDPLVVQAFLHSLLLVAFYSLVPICLGLVLTAFLTRRRIRGLPIWRVVLFLPQVLSVVVVGVAWRWILEPSGPFNQLLRLVGLSSLTRVWFGDYTWALPSEGVIGTWLESGLCLVLFIAGAQSIDTDLYEAASVDGAGQIRQFFSIMIPGLRNVIVVAAVLTFAISLNNFSLIWVTTQGGPGYATQVVSTLIYTRAFVLDEMGDASALAVILGVAMGAISFGITRLSTEL